MYIHVVEGKGLIKLFGLLLSYVHTNAERFLRFVVCDMSNKIQVSLPEEELDWIQLCQDLGPVAEVETTKEKLQRKIKENPLVPLGCLATTAALTAGLYNFRTGNRKMSQLMMRTRIAAQGFTVMALVVGVVMTYTDKK